MFLMTLCLSRIALLLLTLGPAVSALAWGPQGHRVAGTLTQAYLDDQTRRAVAAIVGEQGLASASTWADEMRGNPSPFWQTQAGPYHYVTVPPGRRYAEVGAPAKGDAITALAVFEKVLMDPDAPREQRQLALRFSLHIVQDLHQPLHVGNGIDRGGNDFKVTIAGKGSNLHRVWDSTIIGSAGLSDAAWARRLGRGQVTKVSVKAGASCSSDPERWIAESAALRERIYPASHRLDAGYFRKHLPDVERQLQRAAEASACWLSAVLTSPRSPQSD